jgi:hypothetical protein
MVTDGIGTVAFGDDEHPPLIITAARYSKKTTAPNARFIPKLLNIK